MNQPLAVGDEGRFARGRILHPAQLLRRVSEREGAHELARESTVQVQRVGRGSGRHEHAPLRINRVKHRRRPRDAAGEMLRERVQRPVARTAHVQKMDAAVETGAQQLEGVEGGPCHSVDRQRVQGWRKSDAVRPFVIADVEHVDSFVVAAASQDVARLVRHVLDHPVVEPLELRERVAAEPVGGERRDDDGAVLAAGGHPVTEGVAVVDAEGCGAVGAERGEGSGAEERVGAGGKMKKEQHTRKVKKEKENEKLNPETKNEKKKKCRFSFRFELTFCLVAPPRSPRHSTGAGTHHHSW